MFAVGQTVKLCEKWRKSHEDKGRYIVCEVMPPRPEIGDDAPTRYVIVFVCGNYIKPRETVTEEMIELA